MSDFGGVFEVLAADEESIRLSSRKALLLSEGRIDQRLGKWLAAANSATFDSVYAYSKDDFEGIIRLACEEVGYEKPEAIVATLKAHYRPAEQRRTASVHEARRPKMCPYHNEVVDISLGSGEPQAGYNAMAQHAWGSNHCQGGEYAGGKCNFKREMVSQSFWDERQKNLDEKRELRQEQMGEVPLPQQDLTQEIPEDTIDDELEQDLDTAPMLSDDFDGMDTEAPIDLNPISEPTMALAASIQDVTPLKEERDEVPDRVSASPKDERYNPSEQRDESGKEVPCPQCGGDGKTANNKECSKCKGRGKVNDWGPSTLDNLNSKVADFGFPKSCPDCGGKMVSSEGDRWNCSKCDKPDPGNRPPSKPEEKEDRESRVAADGDNTGLGGPEPTIDKAKWTPQNVKEISDDSKEHPTKRKDPIEPIKAVNDDELEEIGEKTTERVDLPTGSEDKGGGFADGGESKAPDTKTYPKGKHEVDPVTKESISHRMAGWDEYDESEPQGMAPEEWHDNSQPIGMPDYQTPDNLIDEHASGLHYDRPRPDCPSCQGRQTHPYDLGDSFTALDEGGLGVHNPHEDWTR